MADTDEIRTAFFADHPDDVSLDDIDLSRLPKHIAIIMDGNGRWATERGLDRTEGHKAGVDSLRDVILACVRLGVEVMSAYAFSTENWKRPQHEVNLLMRLFARTIMNELPLFERENVRLRFLGDLESLPRAVQESFAHGLDQTKDNTGLTLAIAVNYGARAEIVRAVKLLAQEVAAGSISADDIDAQALASHLYTAGLPDPDLLVRSSGELRLSNFLLWQLAYSEIYISEIYWPDFDRFEILRAIRAYQSRDRRFGGVKSK